MSWARHGCPPRTSLDIPERSPTLCDVVALAGVDCVCCSTLPRCLRVSLMARDTWSQPPGQPPPVAILYNPERVTGLNTIDHGRFRVLPTIQVTKEPTKLKKATRRHRAAKGAGGVLPSQYHGDQDPTAGPPRGANPARHHRPVSHSTAAAVHRPSAATPCGGTRAVNPFFDAG